MRCNNVNILLDNFIGLVVYMKKRLICLCACIVFIISIIPVYIISFADDGSEELGYKFTNETGILEIFDDTQMIDRAENDANQFPWYDYKAGIEHIIIHDGVTKISDYSFCYLDNLVDIVIPESVTSIGIASLSGNDNLKSITLSNNITSIGRNAFGFNSKMVLTPDFECICPVFSYAQQWCLKNYVAFTSPFNESNIDTVEFVDGSPRLAFWSFVPETDCKVKFWSTSNYDTVGMIFDYDAYTYSYSYSELKASAIYYNDDTGNDLDFTLNATLTAGKRYYISTGFKLVDKKGKYQIELEKNCVEHRNRIVNISYDDSGFKRWIDCECEVCGEIGGTTFEDALKYNYDYCDLNNDGVVNAKDYAKMIKGQFN